MGESTKISWTDSTFNPWIGCTHASPGCDHCYAETSTFVRIQRKGSEKTPARELWGAHAERHAISEAKWKEPVAWNREAFEEGRRHRVFCGSLCDVGEMREDLDVHRVRLLNLIDKTPWLDWQLLTKRITTWIALLERIVTIGMKDGATTAEVRAATLATSWLSGNPPRNVWMGTTVEDQRRAIERVGSLYRVPAVVRFVSCEPLLERVLIPTSAHAKLDWIIVGGESGADARPFAIEWADDLVRQARAMGAAPFVKQLGAVVVSEHRTAPLDVCGFATPLVAANGEAYAWRAGLKHPKGGDWDEWPAGTLKVREFPKTRAHT